MKEKVLIFLIGLLIGAILVTCYFVFLNKGDELKNDMRFQGGPPNLDQNKEKMENPPDMSNSVNEGKTQNEVKEGNIDKKTKDQKKQESTELNNNENN